MIPLGETETMLPNTKDRTLPAEEAVPTKKQIKANKTCLRIIFHLFATVAAVAASGERTGTLPLFLLRLLPYTNLDHFFFFTDFSHLSLSHSDWIQPATVRETPSLSPFPLPGYPLCRLSRQQQRRRDGHLESVTRKTVKQTVAGEEEARPATRNFDSQQQNNCGRDHLRPPLPQCHLHPCDRSLVHLSSSLPFLIVKFVFPSSVMCNSIVLCLVLFACYFKMSPLWNRLHVLKATLSESHSLNHST